MSWILYEFVERSIGAVYRTSRVNILSPFIRVPCPLLLPLAVDRTHLLRRCNGRSLLRRSINTTLLGANILYQKPTSYPPSASPSETNILDTCTIYYLNHLYHPSSQHPRLRNSLHLSTLRSICPNIATSKPWILRIYKSLLRLFSADSIRISPDVEDEFPRKGWFLQDHSGWSFVLHAPEMLWVVKRIGIPTNSKSPAGEGILGGSEKSASGAA